jgi:hypothetical protein
MSLWWQKHSVQILSIVTVILLRPQDVIISSQCKFPLLFYFIFPPWLLIPISTSFSSIRTHLVTCNFFKCIYIYKISALLHFKLFLLLPVTRDLIVSPYAHLACPCVDFNYCILYLLPPLGKYTYTFKTRSKDLHGNKFHGILIFKCLAFFFLL